MEVLFYFRKLMARANKPSLRNRTWLGNPALRIGKQIPSGPLLVAFFIFI